jgi:hypothetical protein
MTTSLRVFAGRQRGGAGDYIRISRHEYIAPSNVAALDAQVIALGVSDPGKVEITGINFNCPELMSPRAFDLSGGSGVHLTVYDNGLPEETAGDVNRYNFWTGWNARLRRS